MCWECITNKIFPSLFKLWYNHHCNTKTYLYSKNLINYTRKEGNVLFNDALNTFYLWLYGFRHMVKDYFLRLAARVLLYAPSHRQDNTYHGLCYTSHGALAGTRNSSMGPPHEGSIWRPITPWVNALTTELHLAPSFTICLTPYNCNIASPIKYFLPYLSCGTIIIAIPKNIYIQRILLTIQVIKR